MNKKSFSDKKKNIEQLAYKYNWRYVSNDPNNFRVSFKDELSIYKIDIYLSKMTVCLQPVGDKPFFLRNNTKRSLEAIFKAPEVVEMKLTK